MVESRPQFGRRPPKALEFPAFDPVNGYKVLIIRTGPGTATVTEAALALKSLPVEQLVLPLLLQLAVIVAAARIAGAVARRLWQPSAVGEIVAGLLLGPSLFGWLAPEWSATLFRPTFEGVPPELSAAAFPKILQSLAQLGLVFLLLIIGLEFDFAHLKSVGRTALSVSLAGVALPFGLGALLAPLAHPYLEVHPLTGRPVPLSGLTLFLGVAMSITAIPILGRMLIELGASRTKLGAIVLSAAAIDDAVGWILLATVAAVVKSGFEPRGVGVMVGETVAFTLVMFLIARPLFSRYLRAIRFNGEPSLTLLSVTLVMLFLAAIVMNAIGIFAIFGAFLLGAALSGETRFRAAIVPQLSGLVNALFVPVFFTYTGLQTELRGVGGGAMPLIFLGVLLAAVVGKFGGCGLAALACGHSPRESAIVGVLMNTRALMELIVIQAGYSLGVIPPSLFAMLVLMALLTTMMPTPILLLLRRGTEFEAAIEASGFRRNRPEVTA